MCGSMQLIVNTTHSRDP